MDKAGRFRVFAFTSLMAAGAVILVSLGTFVPGMSMSFAALAGLCPLVSLLAGGKRAALMTYAASGLLCLLTGLTGEAGLAYLCLSGLYPPVKALAEERKSRAATWAVKFVYAHVMLGLLLGVSLLVLPELFATESSLALLLLLYEVLFIAYDYALGVFGKMLRARLKIDRNG